MSSTAPFIRVVAGLGNPGERYVDTRHNVGFILIDQWARHLGWRWKRSFRFRGEWSDGSFGNQKLAAIKPSTFMNASGKSLQAILKYLKVLPEQLMVIYDDITLPVGKLKLSVGGGDGGHNGIKSIQECVGNDFVRFRIGVGQKADKEIDLKDWVLSRFLAEEMHYLEKQEEFYRNSIEKVITTGPVLAMNTINQKQPNL